MKPSNKTHKIKPSKQLSFFKDPRRDTKIWWIKKQTTYGGSFDYRKVERPFDSKKLVHVVFKANLGKGIYFTKSQKSVGNLIRTVADKYQVNIKEQAINKDHIHLLVWTNQRESFLKFLRLFSAEMGRKYKEIFKKFNFKKAKNLWVARPFTRLVSWGKRSAQNVVKYLHKNTQEALGFLEYRPRKHRVRIFIEKWEQQISRCTKSQEIVAQV